MLVLAEVIQCHFHDCEQVGGSDCVCLNSDESSHGRHISRVDVVHIDGQSIRQHRSLKLMSKEEVLGAGVIEGVLHKECSPP